MNFDEIERNIQDGKIDKAKQQLQDVSVDKLTQSQMVLYFRYLRRVGDYHRGLLQIEKYDKISPELDLEKAYFLGEVGAYKQALKLIQNLPAAGSLDLQIEKQLSIGHFSSLAHDYETAIAAYQSMATLAHKERPYQSLIGTLNEVGHRIYAKQNLESQIARMRDLRSSALEAYPLLEQGACYFLSLAHAARNEITLAREELKNAFSIRSRHRLRESLLLKITDFELNGAEFNKIKISTLKKSILEQDHIVYFDQFNKIMGRNFLEKKDRTLAQKYFFKVLYGNRSSSHLKEVQALISLDTEETPLAWEVGALQVNPVTSHQYIYNQFAKTEMPFFSLKKKRYSLTEETKNNQSLVLQLSKNFEFQMREAEVWESVWNETYLYSYSIDRIKSLLTRNRSGSLGEFVQVQYRKNKLSLKWNKDSALILKEF